MDRFLKQPSIGLDQAIYNPLPLRIAGIQLDHKDHEDGAKLESSEECEEAHELHGHIQSFWRWMGIVDVPREHEEDDKREEGEAHRGYEHAPATHGGPRLHHAAVGILDVGHRWKLAAE